MATGTMIEELICPVCLEFYTDPRLLPCHHSLCKACLLALRSKKDNAIDCELQCPSCRHIFHAKDETNVESLPKNFTLASIVCKFQESVKGERDCTCDICEEGQKARAIKKCLQCQLNYCRICLEQLHPQKGALAHHKLVHVMDLHGEKCEKDNACSVVLPSPSTIQFFGTQKYDQLHGARYCRSCDEIYTTGDKMSGEKKHDNHDTTEMRLALRKKREELECMLARHLDDEQVLEKGLADTTSFIQLLRKRVEEKKTELVQRFGELAEKVERRKMLAENRIEEEMKVRITSLESRLREMADLKSKTGLKIAACFELVNHKNDDPSIFLMKFKKLQQESGARTRDYIEQEEVLTDCASSIPFDRLMSDIISNAMQDFCPSMRKLQIPGTKPTNTDILPKHVEMAVKVTNVQKAGMMSADVEWSRIKQAGQYEVSYSCSPNETVVLKKIAENRCKLTNLRWDSTYTIKVTTQLQDGSTVFDEDSFKTDPQVKCLQMAVSKICTEKVLLLNSFDGFKASNMVYNWSYFRKEGEFSGIIVTPFLTEDKSFWTMEVGLSIFEAGELKDIYLDFGIINYSNLMDNKCLTNNKAAYSCTVLRKKKSKFHLEFTNRLSTEVLSYPLPLKFHEKSIFSFGFLYDSVNCQFAVMDCQTQKVLHVFHDVIFDNDDTPVFAIYSSHTARKMCVKIKFDYIHCTNEDISCWMQKIDEF